MDVVIVESQAEAARLVADAVAVLLARPEPATLGLATGSSPVAVYDELARRVAVGALSFADGDCRCFLLDEYLGLAASDPRSYAAYIRERFTDRVDIEPGRVHGLDGIADDPVAEAGRYDGSIRAAGGVDLQMLGIGADGHIGFNEPGSSLASRTRVKVLTEQTRRDNVRFFDRLDDVPRHVLTQGVGTILEARHLVLLAFGDHKAAAVAGAVEGPVTSSCPASALQLHPHVSVLVDEAAASALTRLDYYREVDAARLPGPRV